MSSFPEPQEFHIACQLISDNIGDDWEKLNLHLPFNPRRQLNRRKLDVETIDVSTGSAGGMETCEMSPATNSLFRSFIVGEKITLWNKLFWHVVEVTQQSGAENDSLARERYHESVILSWETRF
jgi:hypothetical protein